MKRHRSSRAGMATFSIMLVVLMFFVLAAMILQSLAVTDRRVQTQTSADQASRASATQMASAMNALVQNQHELGQLHGQAILNLAHGGDELVRFLDDGRTTYDLGSGLQSLLDIEFSRANLKWNGPTVAPDAQAYRQLSVVVSRSGGAIGLARRTLREKFLESLIAHASAVEPNEAIAARYRQQAIRGEWELLDGLEAEAMAEWSPRGVVTETLLIPVQAHRVNAIVQATADEVAGQAHEVASLKNVVVAQSPRASLSRGRLPVVSEADWTRRNGWERSQMVRASTPWVQFGRIGLVKFARENMPISEYAEHYIQQTNRDTLDRSRRLLDEQGISLWVMADTIGEKGTQPWTRREGSRRADELFCLSVVLEAPMPSAVGSTVFGARDDWRIRCRSQAMIFPRQSIVTGPATPKVDWQSTLGWDTLQWSPEVAIPEWTLGTKPGETSTLKRPRVNARWSAKLTPNTTNVGASP